MIFSNSNVGQTCGICNFVLISSTLNFWDIVISYHKSGISCVLDRNAVFDKSDFYKVVSETVEKGPTKHSIKRSIFTAKIY
jgi:hypothetical protein